MEATKVDPTPRDEEPRRLTLDEAATLLKMSRRTLERKINQGKIAPARLGGRGGRTTTLVWSDEVDRYLMEQRSWGYKYRARARKQAKHAPTGN